MRSSRSSAASRVTQAAFDGDDQSHGAETRAADRNEIVRLSILGRTPIWRQPTVWVRALPEETESLPLHDLEQLIIGQRRQRLGSHVAR